MSIDNAELRKAIIHNLLQSQEYCQKVLPFIQVDYFSEKSERIIVEEIQKYVTKYNTAPRNSAIKIEVESRNDLTEAVYKEVDDYLSKEVPPIPKVEYLVNKTEGWCQERAIVNAVYKAVNVIGGEDKKTSMTALPTLLQDAISTSFDKSVGHDYVNDAEDRWEFYNRRENKLETGIEHFDYILRGGLPSKTLGVFMAGTGTGKSLFMCAISANVVERGNNVLYITLEMAEEKIAQRIDQNMMNLTQEEMDTISKDAFLKRFQNVKLKTQGNLIVKEYPTKSAHAGHFRALLKELEMKKNFKPDLICIDYLNICASASAPKGSNSYTEVKATAEELRALAMEFEVPIVTATQTNRSGYSDTDVTLESVSESFGLPATADWFFAITTTDVLKEQGMARLIQLKNRFSDPSDRKNWLVGVDYPKMRVYDLEKQPTTIDAQNEAAQNSITDTKPLMDVRWG